MPNPPKKVRPSEVKNTELRKFLDAKLKDAFGSMTLTGKYCGGAWPNFTVNATRPPASSSATVISSAYDDSWVTPFNHATETPPHKYATRAFTNPYSFRVRCSITGAADDDIWVSKTGAYAIHTDAPYGGPLGGGGPVNVSFTLEANETFTIEAWDGVGGNWWVSLQIKYSKL